MGSRQRRDDEDDRPIRARKTRRGRSAKNRSALPLILGILGVVILFCGGIGALVYFVAIAPKVNMARRIEEDIKKEEAESKVSKTKLNQLRGGMTRAQVEAVMGPGKVADWGDVLGGTGNFQQMEEIEPRWQSARERKLVYVWQDYSDRILVAYSKDPGGTVVGILASIDRSKTYTEAVRLPAAPGGR